MTSSLFIVLASDCPTVNNGCQVSHWALAGLDNRTVLCLCKGGVLWALVVEEMGTFISERTA